MSLRFCNSHSLYHLLLVLVIFCSISAIYAKANEDATIRTMEAFSGYPIHESNSFVTNLASSLSVDAETLQKRVLRKSIALWTSKIMWVFNFLIKIYIIFNACGFGFFLFFWARSMNCQLSRTLLPHQLLGSCTLRMMYWHAGNYLRSYSSCACSNCLQILIESYSFYIVFSLIIRISNPL